jgi:hypothetical protein
MAKKKIEMIEEKYPSSDRIEILRLAKVVIAQQHDLDSIYSLYKKYINEKATMYRTDCNCYTSISHYFQTLLDWYSENSNKF